MATDTRSQIRAAIHRFRIAFRATRGRFGFRRSKRPNVATRKALRDADARRNLLGPFEDTDSMFRELGV